MLFAAAAVFSLSSVNAQEVNFGAKAGVDLASAKAEFDGFSASTSETGFYVGAFAEIGISDEFSVQPEVLYVSIKDLGQIHVPIMAKYGVSDEINLLAGPTVSFLTDTAEGVKSMNYGIEAGASYDITEEILVEARYNIGLANLYEDAPDGASFKLSGFYIGLGYRF